MGAGSSFPLPCCTEMEALDDRVSERVSDAVAVKGCQHRHLDLQTVWRTSDLLNRWTQSEVSALKDVFQQHCHVNSSSKSSVLSEASFFRVFPNLNKGNLDNRTRQGIFSAFDLSDRTDRTVDFRDFCRSLAIACRGTRGELLCLLFDICTNSHTALTANQTVLEVVYHSAIANGSVPKDCSNAIGVSSSESIAEVALCRLLSLCGLTPPPAAKSFSYEQYTTAYQASTVIEAKKLKAAEERSDGDDDEASGSTESASPVPCSLPPPASYSPHKVMTFFEYIDFANAYISDEALGRFQHIFHIVPNKEQERKEVLRALHQEWRIYSAPRELVYIVEESWWQEWCQYVGVKPVYDLSNYCVMDLRDGRSRSYPMSVFSPSATPPNAHSRAAHQHDTPFEPYVPLFRRDILQKPGAIKNQSLLDKYDAYAIDKMIRNSYNDEKTLSTFVEAKAMEKQSLNHDCPSDDEEISPVPSVSAEDQDSSIITQLEDLQLKTGLGSETRNPHTPTKQPISTVKSMQSMSSPSPSKSAPKAKLNNRRFTIVPEGVWLLMYHHYGCGGGPTIPRLVSHYRSGSDVEDTAVWIDIHPLVLHVCFCDNLGGKKPLTLPREVLVNRNDSIDSIVGRILAAFLSSKRENVNQGDINYDDDVICLSIVEKILTSMYKDDDISIRNDLSKLLRVWVLQYDSSILDEDDEEKGNDGGEVVSGRGARKPEIVETDKLTIRHGPLSWWSLTSAFGRGKGNQDVTLSRQLFTNSGMESLLEEDACPDATDDQGQSQCNIGQLKGVTNGGKIMIEVRNILGQWPSDRMVEPFNFRENLAIGSKLDAQDESERWYSAEITSVTYEGSQVDTVKVHFVSFPSRFDAFYPVDSWALAPPGTHTTAVSKIPVYPYRWQELLQNLVSGQCTDYSGGFALSSPLSDVKRTGKGGNGHKKDVMKSLNVGHDSDVSTSDDQSDFVRVAGPGTGQGRKKGLLYACFSCNRRQPDLLNKGNNTGYINTSDRSATTVLPVDGIQSLSSGKYEHDNELEGHQSATLTPTSSASSVSSTPRKGNRHEDVATNTQDVHDSPGGRTPGPKSMSNRLTTPAKSLVRSMFASVGLSSPNNATGPYKSSAGNVGEMNQVGRNTSQVKRQAAAAKSRAIAAQVPGACGLLNIGNTCFMSCGLQCLSHTPLLRYYFLSGRYIDEINRTNTLGTNGRLVAEFAQLLKTLWTSNSHLHSSASHTAAANMINIKNSAVTHYTSPSKFKKVVEKCKPIFSGHDQQDAQEFLSEILDSLHEDVNRVVDKPYVSAPDDAIWDAMTISAQAGNAWGRHLARNSSVLADLFQGQILSEVTCPECDKKSRTFDPFMSLSVPIPEYSEVTLSVYVVRKMPRLPRFHRRSSRRGSGSSSVNIADCGEIPFDVLCEYIRLYKEARTVHRYAIKVPRLGTLQEVKKIVGTACGVSPTFITLAECVDGSMTRLFEDDKHRVLDLKPFDVSCEKWILKKSLGGGNKARKSSTCFKPPPGAPVFLALEIVKDVMSLSNLSGDSLTHKNPRLLATRNSSKDSTFPHYVRGDLTSLEMQSNSTMSEFNSLTPFCYGYIERSEFEECGNDPREGDMLVDIIEPDELPVTFEDIKVGDRLDARDHKGQWFGGQVAFVGKESLGSGGVSGSGVAPIRRDSRGSSSGDFGNRLVRVHFDKFTTKWDELYSKSDFKNGKLASLYSKSTRKLSIFEIFVVNRHQNIPEDVSSSKNDLSSNAGSSPPRVFGVPWVLHMESFRSCEHVYRQIVEQAMRYIAPEEMLRLTKAGLFDIMETDLVSRTEGGGHHQVSFPPIAARDRGWLRTELLPFTVRILSMQDVDAQPNDKPVDLNTTSMEGTLFPRDPDRPIINLYWNRLLVSIDWDAPEQSPEMSGGISNELISNELKVALDSSFVHYAVDGLHRDYIVANHSSHEVEAQAFMRLVDEHRRKQRQSLRQQGIGSESGCGSISMGDLVKQAEGSDDSDEDDEEDNRLAVKGLKMGFGDLTLADCLSAFTKEEKLEDESWYCSNCKKHQRGIVKQSLYRLPDILIIHIKRFNMTARFREKIRAKVDYPLQDLDMRPFTVQVQSEGSPESANGESIGPTDGNVKISSNEDVYDLYGVSNHLGGMSGGHYTAFIRPDCVPSSGEPASTSPSCGSSLLSYSAHSDDKWLLFDDEYVQEVPPEKVVSEAAYVLFYKRKNMTSSNIINLTV